MEGWWEWSVGNGRLLFEIIIIIIIKNDIGVEGGERGCEDFCVVTYGKRMW